MPWVRIDDHFDEHPKLAAAGPLAWALWFAGLAYCNRNRTDGFVPWSVAKSLVSWQFLDGGEIRGIYVGTATSVSEEGEVSAEYVVDLLLLSGLWEMSAGGYQVHDYAQYQPTRADLEALHSTKAAAGAAGGIATATARARANGQHGASTGPAGAVAETQPVPVPVPVPKGVRGVRPLDARDPDAPVDPEEER